MSRVSNGDILAVRRFSRFYTRIIGTLQERALYRPYSLAEARVMFEIDSAESSGGHQASFLSQYLAIDEAYMSRMISKFVRIGLVTKESSSSDRREKFLRLTEAGRKVLAAFNQRSTKEVAKLLKPLSKRQRAQLRDAMQVLEQTLTQEQDLP